MRTGYYYPPYVYPCSSLPTTRIRNRTRAPRTTTLRPARGRKAARSTAPMAAPRKAAPTTIRPPARTHRAVRSTTQRRRRRLLRVQPDDGQLRARQRRLWTRRRSGQRKVVQREHRPHRIDPAEQQRLRPLGLDDGVGPEPDRARKARATRADPRAFSSSSGAKGAGVSGAGGNSAGAVKTAGGDVYAGADGNVYKKTDDGWQKYDNGSWNSVDKPANARSTTSTANAANATQRPAGTNAQSGAAAEQRAAGGSGQYGGERPSGGASSGSRFEGSSQLEQDRSARMAAARASSSSNRCAAAAASKAAARRPAVGSRAAAAAAASAGRRQSSPIYSKCRRAPRIIARRSRESGNPVVARFATTTLGPRVRGDDDSTGHALP